MPNFTKSKIYCIYSDSAKLYYYGSTTQRLAARLWQHEAYADTESRRVLCHEDYKIKLMENYPCENVNQLRARERWYIENNDCVNINIPGRSYKEWSMDPEVKRKINLKIRTRYANEEDYKIRCQDRAVDYYRTLNEEEKQIKKDKAALRNIERDKIRYVCECGTETSIRNKPAHNRNKKHLTYLCSLSSI